MTNEEFRQLQQIMIKVLDDNDSDLLGTPHHGPIIADARSAASKAGLTVTEDDCRRAFRSVLGT